MLLYKLIFEYTCSKFSYVISCSLCPNWDLMACEIGAGCRGYLVTKLSKEMFSLMSTFRRLNRALPSPFFSAII